VSQELERRAAPDIDTAFRVAKGFAMSGYFADAKSAEQAFVKVMAGAEMGLSPFQAMTGIHIIEGKPVVGAGLLAALIDQNPDYEYETEWDPDEKDPTACTVVIFKHGKERGRSRFSLADATAAGIDKPSRNGKPSNWKTYGRNMLYARAMSNAVRWYAPGITGTATYSDADEIGTDEVVPPHIEALDRQAAEREERNAEPIDEEPIDPADVLLVQAREMLDATEEARQGDDVPFDVAAPAPGAETGLGTSQIAAEPAAPASGGLLNTLDDALRFVNTLEKEQLEALRALLRAATPITRRALSMELLDQRNGWDTSDVLEEIT
jgi:hypothetical protein